MDVVRVIENIKQLPPELHWFCCRSGPEDGAVCYPEDIKDSSTLSDDDRKQIQKSVAETRERKALILEGLKIFAFDGADAEKYQKYFQERLDEQLAQCDICIREYHRGRRELKQMLDQSYEKQEVDAFLSKLDSFNSKRIQQGLQESQDILENLPKNERGIKRLQQSSQAGLYALFEALHSEAILHDEDYLAEYFDKSFLLIQEKRPLKIDRFPPAVGYFLFQSHGDRNWWAHASCQRSKRKITGTEFQWSIQEPLSKAMARVRVSELGDPFLPTFWAGVTSLISILDADLITHSLRAMDHDVCRLALDQLQNDDMNTFKHIAISMQKILEISPRDFWESMGATPAATWIDQFFHSRAFRQWLGAMNQGHDTPEILGQIFGWAIPFISSIRPVLQARVCRDLVDVFFNKLQNPEITSKTRVHCQELGFRILATTLTALSNANVSEDVRAAVSVMLDLVQELAPKMISLAQNAETMAEPCAELLRQALRLEVQCIEDDREYLSKDRTPPSGGFTMHNDLWNSSCKLISADNMLMAKSLISGCRGLVGIENFIVSRQSERNPRLEQFNSAFETINSYVSEMIERMNDFDPANLQLLFEEDDVLSAFLMQLLSSDGSVRSAVVDVIKTTSGQGVRDEAFADALTSYFEGVMNAFALGFRRISWKRAFTPASAMLTFSRDLLDILCSSSKGILRVSTMSQRGMDAVENFWAAMWEELVTIFSNTEAWANMGHPREKMMDFCRDVLDFAGLVFEQFPVFVGALSASGDSVAENRPAGKRLTEQPKGTIPVMVKFLRLRDDLLLARSTALVCNVLRRLKQYDSTIESETATSVQDVISGKTKTVLTHSQKAELHRALEENLGTPIAFDESQPKADPVAKKMRAGVIDLQTWQDKASGKDVPSYDSLLDSASQASVAYRQRQAAQTQRAKPPMVSSLAKAEQKVSGAEFARKRQEEIAAKKKRDAEAAARYKSKLGGSALVGIGGAGKDLKAPKGEGVMVSDDSSEEDESMDEVDKMLFGDSSKPKLSAEEKKKKDDEKAKKKIQQPAGPVKKQRLVRSAKDMRARLAPDLAPLHKTILSWDPNQDGSFPPGASQHDYAAVLSTFRDPYDYQRTFQPLLLLEAWNGFLKAKEENQSKAMEMKIITRSSVDAFSEVSASIDQKEQKDITEGDIVLITKSAPGVNDHREPKCLSRVMKIVRKKTHIEFLYRVMPGGPMSSMLNPGMTAQFLKIMPIVPLEREYGALLGLEFYDLCEEIAQAKPSPLLSYKDETLSPYMKNYEVNKAQAEAIKSALDNDAFTLVQGPPGSGKTKTIVAIVGALLTSTMQRGNVPVPAANGAHPQSRAPSKKMLVCAPSNAAVDELVMRFKEGVKLIDGKARPISVVRIGRSDAINANVQDVTLDELIDKRLNVVSEGQAREATTNVMREHQSISAKLREARAKLDEKDSAENRKDVEDLRKSKANLSQKVDAAKDNEGQASRQADLNRRKAQQEIIEEAHVICATLSGSGHDMFQNLNVEFETVVIDEAAQCVELSALIPLKYGCAKCILVGDPQQLPPTVFSKEAANFKYEQSLFVRMQSNHSNAVHLLDTQYRMHPAISSFPSTTFYDGRLKDGPDMARLRTRPWHEAELTGPFRFFDVQGQHQSAPTGHSLVNRAEIRVAMELYRRLTTDFSVDFARKVGVITPYKSQLRELKSSFARDFGGHITQDVEFNTTDAFQGRESEIIIFSCVRASPAGGIGFLQDIRRMNVGLTRAKSSLWVLGNSQSLVKGQYWKKLVEHARSSDCFTQGNIEALLRKPLKKTKKVDAPSAGEKMQMMDVDIGGNDSSAPASRRDSGAMDVDEPKPRKMSKASTAQDSKKRSSIDNMDVDDRKHANQKSKPNNPPPSRSPYASDISVPAKRRTTDRLNDKPKKPRADSIDVERRDPESDAPPNNKPKKSDNDSKSNEENTRVKDSSKSAGTASAASRPMGIVKKPPAPPRPRQRADPVSVFMPKPRQK